MYNVDNAIILAAGTASRFAPLSYEKPKSLTQVRGEILLERQIRQLKEAKIQDITIVVGYKKEKFEYLKKKFGVNLVENTEYLTKNNHSSIYAAQDLIRNTYICSSDNYFTNNPFELEVEESYYSVVYSDDETQEWCTEIDEKGNISNVVIGASKSWYMLGHTFWSETFSKKFIEILNKRYDSPEISDFLWENILIQHLDVLKMQTRRYENNFIFEFDTLDELRKFDKSYIEDSHSEILKNISSQLNCSQKDLVNITAYKDSNNSAAGFYFTLNGKIYQYSYNTKNIKESLL